MLCVLWRLKRLDPKTLMFLLFLLGVLMRLSYAAAYPAEDRQHDVFDADGHLQYILRLADTWRRRTLITGSITIRLCTTFWRRFGSRYSNGLA